MRVEADVAFFDGQRLWAPGDVGEIPDALFNPAVVTEIVAQPATVDKRKGKASTDDLV